MKPATIDLAPLYTSTLNVIKRARLEEPGAYCRFATDADQRAANPYGVADAINLFYTLNRMPRQPEARERLVESLLRMQSEEDGLWHEDTHHPLHTTAHCVAALELLEARPRHPMRGLDAYRSAEGLRKLLDSLDWVREPWSHSHRGAGVFAALLIADEPDAAWCDAYFDWLTQHWDPAQGMLCRGALPGQAEDSKPIHEHMAGTFHYLFNIEADRRPIPHPEAMIEMCLEMMEDGGVQKFWEPGFLLIDWVFCLTRARRQCGHRFADVQAALDRAAVRYAEMLLALDHQTHHHFNDVHALFGTWTALAELQIALPGRLRSPRPLRNVLDRRPFI